MVRTSGGIRISAGKSSKKGGGGSNTGGSSRSAPSTPGKSNSKGGSRLPPIPHTETPSWQKPITNFFTIENNTLNDNTGSQVDKNSKKVNEIHMEINASGISTKNNSEDSGEGSTSEKNQAEIEENERKSDIQLT